MELPSNIETVKGVFCFVVTFLWSTTEEQELLQTQEPESSHMAYELSSSTDEREDHHSSL